MKLSKHVTCSHSLTVFSNIEDASRTAASFESELSDLEELEKELNKQLTSPIGEFYKPLHQVINAHMFFDH
jgi:hypothetical protein